MLLTITWLSIVFVLSITGIHKLDRGYMLLALGWFILIPFMSEYITKSIITAFVFGVILCGFVIMTLLYILIQCFFPENTDHNS